MLAWRTGRAQAVKAQSMLGKGKIHRFSARMGREAPNDGYRLSCVIFLLLCWYMEQS